MCKYNNEGRNKKNWKRIDEAGEKEEEESGNTMK
jgi:hypothetical protein